MNERLKELRKALGLTQEEFAKRLGIKRNAVTNYEVGRNDPADMVVSLICREFSVNESWLRSGEGAPFIEKTRDKQIEEMVDKVMSDKPETFRRRFVAALSALDEDGWIALEKFVDSIYEEGKAAPGQEPAPPAETPPASSDTLTPEEQELLRQYRERKNPAARSSASNAG